MKKILAIDDEPDLTFFIKKNLEMAGDYEVETACDGEEGLLKILSYEPDLVILDLRLPKKSGLEVLKDMERLGSEKRKPPVIILSALKDTNTIMDAEKLGAKDYIIKPYRIEDLLELVKKNIV